MNPTASRGARDARRCLLASLVLLAAFAVEAQFHDSADPSPWLGLLGALTIGLWCAATLGALVLYGVIALAWIVARRRNSRV